MSKNVMQGAGDAATEEKESNNGKIIGGVIGALLIGALLMGGYAILPTAIVVGLLGVALGSVFD